MHAVSIRRAVEPPVWAAPFHRLIGASLHAVAARASDRHAPAGLASRAVVALILGKDDPLNRGAPGGAWLAEPAVDRESGAQSRDLPRPRETVRELSAESVGPFKQRPPGAFMQPLGLLIAQATAPLHRREAGGVQDLIAVSVADTAKETRVGERA